LINPNIIDLLDLSFQIDSCCIKKVLRRGYGEFLWFVEIRCILAAIEGPGCRDFYWSSGKSDFVSFFGVSVLMSQNRFKDILYFPLCTEELT
jgi:Transposase IS4